MTRSTLRNGSRGQEVRLLQSLLNDNGYDLDVDGIFGSRTEAAVRDYQSRYRLSPDGIAGEKTWNQLTGGSGASDFSPNGNLAYTPGGVEIMPGGSTGGSFGPAPGGSGSGASAGSSAFMGGVEFLPGGAVGSFDAAGSVFASPGSRYDVRPGYTPSQQQRDALAALDALTAARPGDYAPSQAQKDAQAALEALTAARPGDYESAYRDRIDDLLDALQNREPFYYDFTADPLYQMYADRAIGQGRMAMRDAMGQAAALTGGYGSSYAQAVGQQAYQNALQGLHDAIPALQEAAYQQYRNRGNEMRANLSALQGLDNTDYGRYRDTVGDWESDRNFAYNQYRDARDFDYGQYRDALGDWQTDRDFAYDRYRDERNFDYGQYRDSMGDWESDRDFDAQLRRDAQAQQNWQTQFDYDQRRDAQAQQNWQAQFDYERQQDALAQQNRQAQWEDDLRRDALSAARSAPAAASGGAATPQSGKSANATPEAPKATANTDRFLRTLMSEPEFNATDDGYWGLTNYPDYLSYVQAELNAWIRLGKLTDSEAMYLMNRYHFV